MEPSIFDAMSQGKFEMMLNFKINPETGLKMIIAIHDQTLRPALGGIRFFDYKTETDAIKDVMRLAKGMTYKNAIIHKLSNGRLSHGGGKAVIWGNPKNQKTQALLLSAADTINELRGAYVGGEDMGMTVKDIEVMRTRTKWVAGLHETHHRGGYRGGGNPASMTAVGVFEGIRACIEYKFGYDLGGLGRKPVIAIQGVGNVGSEVFHNLITRNTASKIIITDANDIQLEMTKWKYHHFELEGGSDCEIKLIKSCEGDSIYDEECDVFVPCAVGGIINDQTIQRFKCKIIAGAANNQLLEPKHGLMLKERGILFAPDYVINAGGAINVAEERQPDGYDYDQARETTHRIGPLLKEIFFTAARQNTTPEIISNEIAEQELERARKIKYYAP